MSASPESWTSIPEGSVDLRLVVTDMDGTLLTSAGQLPDGFEALLQRLVSRGVTLVPASGRQLATLRAGFAEHGLDTFIAENGTLVVQGGEVVATTTVDLEAARRVIRAARDAGARRRLGIVLCGVRGAFVESADEPFLGQARTYYHQLEVVPDLLDVQDEILKVAIYEQDDAAALAQDALSPFAQELQVVISGKHWVDLMPRDADKGRGVRALQESLGITAEQTAVFGDYLNDLALYPEAHWSFAMANAHPGITAVARFEAPSNDDAGVVQVLRRLTGED